MAHLVNGNPKNRLTPPRDRLAFPRTQPLADPIAQTERGIEIGAHQIVLELCGLVQRVQQALAGRHTNLCVHQRSPRESNHPDTVILYRSSRAAIDGAAETRPRVRAPSPAARKGWLPLRNFANFP